MGSVLRIVIWTCLVFFIQQMVNAQETTPEAILSETIRAQFIADTFSPLVGEPVELTLVADLPPAAELVAWPEINDSWGEFDIRQIGELEIVGEVDDGQRLRQRITIILWEPRDYETPETLIGYRLPGIDETYFAPFTPAFFSVPSVLDQTDLVLRPLREQISLFYVSPLLVVAGAGVSAGILYGAWRFWKWRQSLKPQPMVAIVSPAQQAFTALQRLNDTTLETKQVVIEATDVLREYIASRLMIDAPEMTTAEVAGTLTQKSMLSSPMIDELLHLLERGDLIKFTQMQVGAEDAGRFLDRAFRWVTQVENTLRGGEGEFE